jgi:hypothetical protein
VGQGALEQVDTLAGIHGSIRSRAGRAGVIIWKFADGASVDKSICYFACPKTTPDYTRWQGF